MDFFYNSHTKKYILGYTEYTKEEFINYINSGMLANALSQKQNFDIETNDDFTSPFLPLQKIFYGVPGSGKSHKVADEIKSAQENQVVRVVFHPEYTNADFVGQIMPTLNDTGVSYKFRAGPFSHILKMALKNPDKKFFLVIEEINRGNAAAIFGDLFQLLDRDKDGWSVYPVENLDINSFVRSAGDSRNDDSVPSTVQIGDLTFTANTGLRLPPNLSLLATMNTSDQNVFTLDNAFQRRWEMELVENKFGTGNESENQRGAKIEGTQIKWETFQTRINALISDLSKDSGLSSMVDKRLGCWFVKAEEVNGEFIIKKDVFKNKILKYLWDDAFKFNRDVFADENGAEFGDFEKLLEKVDFAKENFGVFKDIKFEKTIENNSKKIENAENTNNEQNIISNDTTVISSEVEKSSVANGGQTE